MKHSGHKVIIISQMSWGRSSTMHYSASYARTSFNPVLIYIYRSTCRCHQSSMIHDEVVTYCTISYQLIKLSRNIVSCLQIWHILAASSLGVSALILVWQQNLNDNSGIQWLRTLLTTDWRLPELPKRCFQDCHRFLQPETELDLMPIKNK